VHAGAETEVLLEGGLQGGGCAAGEAGGDDLEDAFVGEVAFGGVVGHEAHHGGGFGGVGGGSVVLVAKGPRGDWRDVVAVDRGSGPYILLTLCIG
jgi:hypothetical protein